MPQDRIKFRLTPQIERAKDATITDASGWVSVSSETPCLTDVDGQKAYLVLSHAAGAIDQTWIKDGIQLTDQHGGDVVAIAKPVAIRNGKLGGENTIWSVGERAKVLEQDYASGVRLGVSVTGDFAKSDFVQTGEKDGIPLIRVARWSCVAAALVPIPADPTVGFQRSLDAEQVVINTPNLIVRHKETEIMSEVTKTEVKDNGKVVAEVFALARQYDVPGEITQGWLASSMPLPEVREIILRDYAGKAKTERKTQDANTIGKDDGLIGMSNKDISRYSVSRAILSMIPGSGVDCTLEREASAATAKRMGKAPSGVYMPYDVLVKRALTVAAPGTGANLVASNLLGGSFIDILKSRMVLSQLGCTWLPGLTGDVLLPKKTTAVTGYWVAEGEDPTEGDIVIGQVKLSPHTCGAYVDASRQLLLQSTPAIDELITLDITDSIARVVQAAAFHGTNANNQPKGLALQLSGASIADMTVAVDGSPTWAEVCAFEGGIEAANVDGNGAQWVTAPGAYSNLRAAARNTAAGLFIANKTAGQRYIADDMAYVTTSVASKHAFYGQFSDLVVAMWSALDLTIDPYSLSKSGGLRVVGLQDVDIAVRNAASFRHSAKFAANA